MNITAHDEARKVLAELGIKRPFRALAALAMTYAEIGGHQPQPMTEKGERK